MLYRFIFKILKELAETQQDLEITRSSNMTILTLLLEKKICSKEEYVSTFNEIQSKNMENINQIKNKIHEDENLTKLIEAMVCVCQEDEDVTIRQNALQCIYELTNKILDMQVKDKYLNPIVVDINQK